MASTIAAITTSGGGVVTTADSSGNLSLLSDATTVVAVTSTGVAVTGSLNTPNTFGFKNRIINGGMVIDQRNAGASVSFPTTAAYYTVDRWYGYNSVASKFTVQQNAGSVTPPVGFTKYLGVTSTSAYSVLAADAFIVVQAIEGQNIADLGWGAAGAATVTLSFWVRSSLTGTFGGSIQNSGSTRSYPFSYTISAANTWEQKSVTIAGDTSGTWLTTNGTGISVVFGMGVGSTGSGTAGTWAGANYSSATGATSVVGTNGATFYITGVQLEKGSTATSFDFRDYGRELAMCQRYFQMTFSQGTAPASASGQGGALLTVNGSGTGVSTGIIVAYQFPTEMRVGPSVVTTYNPTASGSGWYLSSGASIAAATTNAGTRGVTVYNNATSVTNTNAAIHLTCSAEL